MHYPSLSPDNIIVDSRHFVEIMIQMKVVNAINNDFIWVISLLAEEGGLFVFYGGYSFPSGNATRGCLEVDPCPGEKVE